MSTRALHAGLTDAGADHDAVDGEKQRGAARCGKHAQVNRQGAVGKLQRQEAAAERSGNSQ